MADGLLAGGVRPVLKHLPGHGRARADSHKELPVVDTDRATLERTDFAAFRPLAGLPLGMTAHVVFSAIDRLAPATTSVTMVREVIRGSIGFAGLLMSDDVSMGALSGTIAERSQQALAAGCDVVLHCNGNLEEMVAVAGETPELADEAARRADAALAARKAPEEFDTEAARFSIADVTNQLLAEEDRLASERQTATDRSLRAANAVTIATELGQALLMCLVIWVAERQTRRRLVAETAQREAIGRARLIVEAVREPIAVIGADFTLLQANRAFGDFYGIRDAGVALDSIAGWTDSALLQRLRDVLALRRELWDYETTQTDATDTERRVIVNARTIQLPDSAGAAVLVTVSDVTARKHSEDQIVELNRQLSGKVEQITEVNRELEAFSYSVSHDLRAPLRHISGFADKLNVQLGDGGDPKLSHYCSIIADSARRMSTLIEDLLAYSRLGQHALRLQPVDLQSLIEEIRSTLMSSIEDRRVEWRIAPLPVVIGDASMLRLAWQNLIDNAIKYTASRGPAQIEIGFRDTDDGREFWIRDNGVGFDMKYADKLFGVFQRLHKASEFQGTGIGLASVRRIIARHGGRTWAEAGLDQGATIHFTLPLHETHA